MNRTARLALYLLVLLGTVAFVPEYGLVFPRPDRQSRFFRDYELQNRLPGVNLQNASETTGSSTAAPRYGYVEQSRETTYYVNAGAVPSEIAAAACRQVEQSLAMVYRATFVHVGNTTDFACAYDYRLPNSTGTVRLTARPSTTDSSSENGSPKVELHLRIDEEWFQHKH